MSSMCTYQYVEYGKWVMDWHNGEESAEDGNDRPYFESFDEWTLKQARICLFHGRTIDEEIINLGWKEIKGDVTFNREKMIETLIEEIRLFHKEPSFFIYLDEDSPERDVVRILVHHDDGHSEIVQGD